MKLQEFFQGKSGKLSATRLAFILWSVGILFAWLYISIAKKELQPIDSSMVMTLGVFMTGKVTQSFVEKPKSSA
jgi:hypothetical protein